MRRNDREISDRKEIERIIGRCDVCRLGMSDGGSPYVIPMNFGCRFENGGAAFYLHSAAEGRKIELLKRHPEVCIELDCGHQLLPAETACGYSMAYESVIAFGRAELLSDPDEKRAALTVIMRHYADRESFSFDSRMVDQVAVIKVAVSEISGKRKPVPPGD